MPRRLEQLNEQLRTELANLLVRELPLNNGLITICYVECSVDLKYAKIGVSVLPDKLAPAVLKKLNRHSSAFCQILRKKLKIRQIPKFNWVIDATEKKAAAIEKILEQIKNENSPSS